MRLALCLLIACGSAKPTPWQVPTGWKHELIPFPLDFAPSLPHKGVEELRFAPGFFDPKAPGYWSYAFVWRIEGNPTFDANTVAAELTTYFRGLIAAVDERIADRDSIVVKATGEGELALTAHVIDPFTTKQTRSDVSLDRNGCGARATLGLGQLSDGTASNGGTRSAVGTRRCAPSCSFSSSGVRVGCDPP